MSNDKSGKTGSQKYVPGYSDDQIIGSSRIPNISGKSPQANLLIEDSAQAAVATSETWLLAKEVNGGGDSKRGLEALGFKVTGDHDLFYEVQQPKGWIKETQGFWTTVKDETGKERISQFYKGAWYDTRTFLNFSN